MGALEDLAQRSRELEIARVAGQPVGETIFVQANKTAGDQRTSRRDAIASLASMDAEESGHCSRGNTEPLQHLVGELLEVAITLVAQQQNEDFRVDFVQPELLAREAGIELQVIIVRRYGPISLKHPPQFPPPSLQAPGIECQTLIQLEVLGVAFWGRPLAD